MRGTHIRNGKTSSLHKCVQDEARDRGLSSSSLPRARMLARVESSPTGREATHTPGGGGMATWLAHPHNENAKT